MSEIVHKPPRVHACSPGWTWDEGVGFLDKGLYGTPPSPQEYPRGTVWECDCGRTWVVYRVDHGIVHFRREGRLARWRRERKATNP